MASKTKRFHLEWNNAKLPISNPDARYGMKNCEGVQFANGCVALDINVCYENMTELEHHIGWHGQYTLTFEPEQIEEGQSHAAQAS